MGRRECDSGTGEGTLVPLGKAKLGGDFLVYGVSWELFLPPFERDEGYRPWDVFKVGVGGFWGLPRLDT